MGRKRNSDRLLDPDVCRNEWCGAPHTQCSPGCSRPSGKNMNGSHRSECPCRVFHGLATASAPAAATSSEDVSPQATAASGALELDSHESDGLPSVAAFITALDWHKPVKYDRLAGAMQEIWGSAVQLLVVLASKSYIVLRRFMELHRRSEFAAEPFTVEKCVLYGDYLAEAEFKQFVTTTNQFKKYRCKGYSRIRLPVSFLNSCRMLNLHCVDSIHDPVQVKVRENILACAPNAAFPDYLRSVVRAVLIVHATRRYEVSHCVRACELLSEDNILQCLIGGRANVDKSLKRRPTSEGRFCCEASSEVMFIIGRSNVLDTLPGRARHGRFEEAVGVLVAAFDDQRKPINTDAVVLDQVWELFRNFVGFGGANNAEGGDSGGLILKNVVYQGLRNVLYGLGLERAATSKFCSGPNPRKLTCVYYQLRGPSRRDQLFFYERVLEGIGNCQLAYGSATSDLALVDRMVVQDNLCKLVEVLMTTSTGNFYGKARDSSLETYGDPCVLRKGEESEACSEMFDESDREE